jgi:AraC-like DNA-binding protein
MNTRLNQIQNWSELAEQARWSLSALAKRVGVSLRTLERYVLGRFGKCPRAWIAEVKEKRVIELFRDGCNVNETATKLGYAHTSSFCHKFRGLREKAMKTPESQSAQANMSQTPNSFPLHVGSRCSNLQAL